MKTTVIITPSERDYNIYVLQQKQTDPDVEYVHVSSLNQAQQINTVHEVKSITNAGRCTGLNNIVSDLNKKLFPYYDQKYDDKQREADKSMEDYLIEQIQNGYIDKNGAHF